MKKKAQMKPNIITIDLNLWCTQTTKARETGVKQTLISQKVCRLRAGKPQDIEILEIPELNNLVLVKRTLPLIPKKDG